MICYVGRRTITQCGVVGNMWVVVIVGVVLKARLFGHVSLYSFGVTLLMTCKDV